MSEGQVSRYANDLERRWWLKRNEDGVAFAYPETTLDSPEARALAMAIDLANEGGRFSLSDWASACRKQQEDCADKRCLARLVDAD